jgi:DNA-binding XRE family transcriptional regulator/transposase-like protein
VGALYPKLRDADWLRHQYLDLGRTVKDIAAEIGCSMSGVSNALCRRGIHKHSGKRRADLSTEWLRQQYIGAGRSVVDLAEEVGVSRMTVRRALVDAGIAIRPLAKPPELDDRDWCEAHQHESHDELADRLGTSGASVRRAMQSHGFAPLPRPETVPYPQLVDADWMRTRYEQEGMTQTQIANLIGCTRNAVAQAMSRLGIEARPKWSIKYPELHDEEWLAAHIGKGKSESDIAKQLGCDPKTVRLAFQRHRSGA